MKNLAIPSNDYFHRCNNPIRKLNKIAAVYWYYEKSLVPHIRELDSEHLAIIFYACQWFYRQELKHKAVITPVCARKQSRQVSVELYNLSPALDT